MGTHYAVLDCDHDSPYEEIKRKYQELVLRYHPDKTNDCKSTKEKFFQINEAWKVLREPESRHKYDAELKFLQTVNQPLIYASLRISELDYDDENYSYRCRCGGLYIIPKIELMSPESLVDCDECSFSILINS